MFILLVEYGSVHRGDCINCETCYFCFDPAFVWPSIFHCYFIVYYYILGFHQLIDWPSRVHSPRYCEIRVLSASHTHNLSHAHNLCA